MFAAVCFGIAMLLAIPAYAGTNEPVRPPCNAQSRGKIWPEKTTRGTTAPISICTAKFWSYHWQQLTVDASELRRDHSKAVAEPAGEAKANTGEPPAE